MHTVKKKYCYFTLSSQKEDNLLLISYSYGKDGP